MALETAPLDEYGNPILQADPYAAPDAGMPPVGDLYAPAPTDPTSGAPAAPDPSAPDPTAPDPTPAPAPTSSEPQPTGPPLPPMPEFGQGGSVPTPTIDFPQVPAFQPPAPQALAQADPGAAASAIYASDPGAPGDRYSGGSARRSNPLRETAVGQALARGGRAGSAYGNPGASDGLTGGGFGARTIPGTETAEGVPPPSDLLLQLMQLLQQQGQG